MFADEARFGRINRLRPCWAPIGIRPEVASQLMRNPVQRGHRFQRKADSIPVIADSG
jgi:hypothetical protein